jgi:hypothetical protein
MSTFFSDCISSKVKCCQCLYEKGKMQTWEKRTEAYWPCYFSKHQLDIGHLRYRSCCMRDWVKSVSIWETMMQTVGKKIESSSPCYFWKRRIGVEPLSLRFHCLQGQVWSVSARERKYTNDSDKKKILTLLFWRRSTRYWAAPLPILLNARLSEVKVYMRSCWFNHERKRYSWAYLIISQSIE